MYVQVILVIKQQVVRMYVIWLFNMAKLKTLTYIFVGVIIL